MKRLIEVVKLYYKKVSVKKIVTIKTPEGLGRWNVDHCVKKQNRKVDLANEDHCGPCGNLRVDARISLAEGGQYKLEK